MHNDRCHDCKYRLMCGAGCRACACGENSTDYLGIDEETCLFYRHGWYEKAKEMIEKYKNCFSEEDFNKTQSNSEMSLTAVHRR